MFFVTQCRGGAADAPSYGADFGRPQILGKPLQTRNFFINAGSLNTMC